MKAMSDEQLIKWLRDDSEEHRKFFPSDGAYFKMHQQAADRIDQLTAERDKYKNACHKYDEQEMMEYLPKINTLTAERDALAERVRELEECVEDAADELEECTDNWDVQHLQQIAKRVYGMLRE